MEVKLGNESDVRSTEIMFGTGSSQTAIAVYSVTEAAGLSVSIITGLVAWNTRLRIFTIW